MSNTTDEKQASEKEKSAAQLYRFSWVSVGILFSAFAFITLVVVFYAGYYHLIKTNTTLAGLIAVRDQATVQNQHDIVTLRETVDALQQQWQQARNELMAQQQEIQGAQKGNKEIWSISEAQYLVQLANDNLQLGDNLPLIIQFLQTADQKLRDLSDPKLLLIRKALAIDIASLQDVPHVDTTGIYLQLAALNEQVDKLPLPTRRPVVESEKNMASSPAQSWWSRGLQQSWSLLRQIVIVRYNQPGVRPFVSPEQQDFLYQNLHAVLAQAMFAVIHKQPDIYHSSLLQAAAWVKQYFLPESPVTQAVLKNLAQLQTINVRPTLPAISASLQAFRDYLNQESNLRAPTTPAQRS